MQYIDKSKAPLKFIRYLRRRGASFKDLSDDHNDVKQALRKALVTEQGYICCYCGKEITLNTSIIEHIKDRDHYPQLQLEYANMVCSCNGGRDKRTRNPQYPLSCDASKGNKEIFVSPVEESCHCRFLFHEDGFVSGCNEKAKKTIDVLNLNNVKLKNQRKSAIDAYRYLQDEDVDWREELQYLSEVNADSKFLPFCFVLKNYILDYKVAG